MRGLEGVRKARFKDGDTVVLTVRESTWIGPSQIRKALPKRYSMTPVRFELTGEVVKRSGKLCVEVGGRSIELREGETGAELEHPFRRLRRLFDNGLSTFSLGGEVLEEEEKEEVRYLLAITAADLPGKDK